MMRQPGLLDRRRIVHGIAVVLLVILFSFVLNWNAHRAATKESAAVDVSGGVPALAFSDYSGLERIGALLQEEGQRLLPEVSGDASGSGDVLLSGGVSLNVSDKHVCVKNGELWKVRFTTQGTADLEIFPLKSATGVGWTEMPVDKSSTPNEMTFLGIYCGATNVTDKLDVVVNDSGVMDVRKYVSLDPYEMASIVSLKLERYSCSEESYIENNVHVAGFIGLGFAFGDAYDEGWDDTCCTNHDMCPAWDTDGDDPKTYGSCLDGWCILTGGVCSPNNHCEWGSYGTIHNDACGGDTATEWIYNPGNPDVCTTKTYSCNSFDTCSYTPNIWNCVSHDWSCGSGACTDNYVNREDGCWDYGSAGCATYTHYCSYKCAHTPAAPLGDDYSYNDYYCPSGTGGNLYVRNVDRNYYCTAYGHTGTCTYSDAFSPFGVIYENCQAQDGWYSNNDWTCNIFNPCQRDGTQTYRDYSCDDPNNKCSYTTGSTQAVSETAPAGMHCSGGAWTSSGSCASSTVCLATCSRQKYYYECNSGGSCFQLDYSDPVEYSPLGQHCDFGSFTSTGYGCVGSNQCDGSCSLHYPLQECDNYGGNCNVFDSWASSWGVTAGKVCSGGVEVDASVSTQCSGSVNACTSGQCTGTIRHPECNGAGVCDSSASTYYQPETVYAGNGYTLTSSCGTTGSTPCSTGSYTCTSSCQRAQPNYVCNGAGTCNVFSYYSGYSSCGATTVCSGGSCISGNCDSTYRCSAGTGDNLYNSGGSYTCQGTCDGGGSCDYATGCSFCPTSSASDGDGGVFFYTPATCTVGGAGCSGGSCISGSGGGPDSCSGIWNILEQYASGSNCPSTLGSCPAGCTSGYCRQDTFSTCPVITNPGTYQLSTNIVGSPNDASEIRMSGHACVKIASSNVIFDCNGYNITNDGTLGYTFGIAVNGSATSNVTIRNCSKVAQYYGGIQLHNAVGVRVVNVTAFNNTGGFGVELGKNSNLTNCTSLNTTGGYGFYVDSSPNTTIFASRAYRSLGGYSGFSLLNSSNSTLMNNTADSNSADGFYISLSNNTRILYSRSVSNSDAGVEVHFAFNTTLGFNNMSDNSGEGISLEDSVLAAVYNSTVVSNTNYGLYVSEVGRLNFTSNNVSGNSGYAVSLSELNHSNITGNAVSGSNDGVVFSSAFNNSLVGNTIYSHSSRGIFVYSSDRISVSGGNVYGSGYADVEITNPGASPMAVNFSGVVIDNPAGTWQNYTNLSMNDDVGASSSYDIKWDVNTVAKPVGKSAFRDKSLNISVAAGSVSIDYFAWYWLDSELSGYTESRFELWKYSSSGGWSVLNNTPNTGANTLSLANINPASDYIILETAQNCPNITVSGSYLQPMNYTGAINPVPEAGAGLKACLKIGASDVIWDCNTYQIYNNGVNNAFGVFINASARNVTLRNCPGISGYNISVYLHNTNNNTVSNIVAYNSSVEGIFVANGINNTFTGNTVHNNTDGITAWGGRNNNFISNIAVNQTQNGFVIFSTNNNTLFNNTAYLNGYAGFQIEMTSNNTFTNNTAYGNSLNGFTMEADAFSNIYRNNTAHSNQHGFWSAGTDVSVFDENYAYSNSGNGFNFASGSDNNTFSRNAAFNNSNSGFYILGSSNGTFTNNTVYNNSQSGFELWSGSHRNTFVNNTVFRNLNTGFKIIGSNSSNLTSNVAYQNQYSFFGSGMVGANLKWNTAYNNTWHGFQFWNTNLSNFTENAAYGNAGSGFALQSGSRGNILRNNTAYNNTAEDYYLEDSVSNLLTLNRAYNSSRGIYLTGVSTGNNFTNNTVQFNTYGAYLDAASVSNLFYYNNFSSSAAMHAYAASEGNLFNTTNGTNCGARCARGNYWSGIDTLSIFDSNRDGFGDVGSQYPYNSTNSGNVSANINDWGPITGKILNNWNNITWPEGVYEPYNVSLVSYNHQYLLNFTFRNFTAYAGFNLTCIIDLKNGQYKTINTTLSSDIAFGNYSLVYSMSASDANSIRRSSVGHIPWEVVNCSLYEGNRLVYTNTSDYGSLLQKKLYVHNNSWSGFIADGDATAAALCWLGRPAIWFNNTRQCHFAGDRAYAIALSKGNKIEGYCYDGIDNDASTKWDCNSSNQAGKGTDSLCKGLFYSCGSPEDGLTYDQVHPQLSIVPLLPYFNPFNPKAPPFMPFLWLALALLFTYFSANVRSVSSFLPLRYAAVIIPFLLFVCTAISSIVILSASSAPVEAVYVDPAPANCDGNICSGSVSIGGDILNYSYTLHNRPNGRFKLRWIDGSIASANSLIFAANALPDFIQKNGTYNDSGARVNHSSYVVPYDGIYLVGGKRNYVTSDSDGYNGYIDGVMWANFSSGVSTAAPYAFELYAAHAGSDMVITSSAPLYFDASAPTNDDEGYTNTNMDLQYPCADNLVDNDLDMSPDCLDIDCDGEIGSVALGAVCQYNGETNCTDRFDNDFDDDSRPSVYDLDYNTGMDCRDVGCNDTQGDPVDASDRCYWKNEYASYPLSCRDSFNNDADNGEGVLVNGAGAYSPTDYTDCLDSDCWAKGGTSSDIVNFPCPARENNTGSWCADSIDNDYDDGNNTRDKNAATGVDCRDYDCRLTLFAGGSFNNVTNIFACAINEYSGTDLGTPGYTPDGDNCFDGIDNDIDNPNGVYSAPAQNVDCGDSDCFNVTNPANPDQVCSGYEFNLTLGYQYCNDNFDNDGDMWNWWPGGRDCTDYDCYQKFQMCGPCPSMENYTYDSCADGIDNDYDNTADSFTQGLDCRDVNCTGEIGNLTGSQLCAVPNTGEASNSLCSDGFDNDADSLVDCLDSGCAGFTGASGAACQFGSESSYCGDNADNDADSLIDCFDTDCYTNAACGIYTVSAAYNFTVPSYDYNPPGTLFPGTSTQRSYQLNHLYVNMNHTMTFTGSSAYNDVFIYLGSALDRYIYNYTSCALQGPNASSFVKVDSGGFGYVTETLIGSFSNYDFTLNCSTNVSPMASDSFNVLASASLAAGGADEGNRDFASQLHENTAPSVNAVRIEPLNASSYVNVVRGRFIGFVANATDPGAGLSASNISYCNFSISGGAYALQNSGLCRYTYATLNDASGVTVSAFAVDGSSNIGAPYSPAGFNINVLPILYTNLTVNKTKPFFNSTEGIHLDVSFITADNGDFSASRCNVTVRSSTGSLSYHEITRTANGNMVDCNGTIAAPAGDNMYRVYVNVTDEDGDTAKSNERVFYVCDTLVSGGTGWTCAKADFDQDGATEGMNTTLYGDSLACDNCVGRYNPEQRDRNANGIGDICEPAETNMTIVGPNGTEITGTRNVMLQLTFRYPNCMGACRYANDNATNLTAAPWENCTTVKPWILSEAEGNKTAFFEFRDCHGTTTVFNDSIIYRFMQDYTGPTAPVVYDGIYGYDIDWWNSNTSLGAYWWNATDDISSLYYMYRILDNSACLGADCNWTNADEAVDILVENLSLVEGHNYSFQVFSYISSGLNSANATSNGTIIDITRPLPPVINSTTHPSQGTIYNNGTVRLNFTSSDPLGGGVASGVDAYSYLIDAYPGTAPDSSPESRYWFTLESLVNDGYSQLLRANGSAPSPDTYAVFSQLSQNFTANESLKVRVALAEILQDSSDLMGVKVYLVRVGNGAAITASTGEADAVSTIANVSRDIRYAGSMSQASVYEFSITVNSTSNDNTNDMYLVVSGVQGDNDNRNNLSIAGSRTAVDASTRNWACSYPAGSCVENTTTVDYAIEVRREDSGAVWDVGYGLRDGTYYFHAMARDRAGNWGNASHYMLVIDTAGVNIDITSPFTGQLFGDPNVSVTVEVNDNANVTVFAVHPDGSNSTSQWALVSAAGTLNVTLENGTNRLYARAINPVNGAVTYSQDVYVIMGKAVPASNRTLRVQYTGAGALASMLRGVDEGAISVGFASENRTASWAADSLMSDTGRHTIKIFATTDEIHVSAVNSDIEDDDFLDRINPSFGYSTGASEYVIRTELRPLNIHLSGDAGVNPGAHRIVAKNMGRTPQGRANVTLRIT